MAVPITLPTPDDPSTEGTWGTTINAAITAINNGLGIAMGLPGAATQARFVGGTASGPPTTGTFQTLDFVITATGDIYVCTTGGSPGTWTKSPSGNSLSIVDNGDGTSTVSTPTGSGSIVDNGDGTVTITG